MSITHATIIPLIGGEALASTDVFGSRPDYILSYDVFKEHESHLLNYWNNEVPYYVLDKGQDYPHTVDVMSSVCPCAGLSQLSHGFGTDNVNNQWMIKSAEYVLGQVKPKVYWGENAPGLAGKIGKDIREQLIDIGKKHGYTMSLYRTRNLLHGVPQVRERTFYFFWQGNQIPLLHYYNKPYPKIEELIKGITSNFQTDPINNKTPTDDPLYKYILQVIHGGISHKEFCKVINSNGGSNGNDVSSYIEKQGHTWLQVAEWMRINNYPKEVTKCEYKHNKLAAGGQIMRRGTVIPKDHIGAFVGHYPTCLTHPVEDRYINYREAMTIMGLPDDMELLNPKKNYNHICQNVPYLSAFDMATEVKAYLENKRELITTDFLLQSNRSKTHKIVDVSMATNLDAFI